MLLPVLSSVLLPLLGSPLDRRRRSLNAVVRAALFGNNELGVMFYLDDALTATGDGVFLFQDSAGTTPVTAVGQAVGLYLDRRFALAMGTERLGTGAIGLLGTAAAATYNAGTGVGTAQRVDAANQSYVQFGSLNASSYRVSMANTGASNIALRSGGPAGVIVANISAGTSFSGVIPSASGLITITSSSGDVAFTVSRVRELPGNHRTATGTTRPVLGSDSFGLHLLPDGSDDFMQGTMDFSAHQRALGLECVGRQSGGTQIHFELASPAASTSGGLNQYSATNWLAQLGTSPGNNTASATPTDAAPVTKVRRTQWDRTVATAAQIRQFINGVETGTTTLTGTPTTGQLASGSYFTQGRSGGLFSNAKEYALVVRAGTLPSTEIIAMAERWAASKAGLTI